MNWELRLRNRLSLMKLGIVKPRQPGGANIRAISLNVGGILDRYSVAPSRGTDRTKRQDMGCFSEEPSCSSILPQ